MKKNILDYKQFVKEFVDQSELTNQEKLDFAARNAVPDELVAAIEKKDETEEIHHRLKEDQRKEAKQKDEDTESTDK